MTEPTFEIQSVSYCLPPTPIIGRDAEGHLLILCPHPSCTETATVMDDGEIRCPAAEIERTLYRELRRAYEQESRP